MTSIQAQSRAEDLRLAALRDYGVLDTPPEQGFDDIVLLATQICATPVALVSLVADDRQWFKARIGFPRDATPLNESVCTHVLGSGTVLVIPDLSVDARTERNPLVIGDPHLRFYAGAPLITGDGLVLGTLCVIDHVPRPQGLLPEQLTGLQALARQVMAQLELRRALAARDAHLAEQRAGGREREALSRTQGAISVAGGDLDIILDALVRGAIEAVPAAEGGVIELVDGDELEYRAVRGTVAARPGLRVPLDGSLAGACARANAPLLVPDMLADPRAKRDLVARLDLRSAVFAPVTRAGKVLGVLKLQSSQVAAFTERDLQLAGLFAGAAAAGLTEVSEVASRRAGWASERRYRAIFESAVDYAIIVLDLDGRVTDWNTGATHILGWTAEDMHGHRLHRLWTPEDRSTGKPEAELRDALAFGRGVDERWHLRRSGERFWANGEMMALRDVRGEAIGFVKFLRDRTEQRQGFEQLQNSERQLLLERSLLAAILQQAPIGISIAFADGRSMLNARAERMLNEVAGEGHDRYASQQARHADGSSYAADDHPAMRSLHRGEVIEGEPMHYRVAHTGELRRWEVSSTPLRDAKGGIVAAVSVFVDIEDQLRSNEALQASEERLNLALTAAGSLGWYDWNIPDDRLYAGESFARMYGVDSAVAARGAPLADYMTGLHPGDRDWVADVLRDTVRAGDRFDVEYRLLSRTGEVTWVHSLGRISSRDGTPQRFTGVVLDVTARKATEQRQAALAGLGDSLRDLPSVADMVSVAAGIVGRALGVARAGFGRLDSSGEHVDVESDWAVPGLASIAGRHRLGDYGDLREELLRGEPLVIGDVLADARTSDSSASWVAIDTRAMINMPVRERGRTVALFTVHDRRARAWTADEVAFLRTVADRVASGVARIHADQQRILQNHELSHRLKNTLAMVQAIAAQTLRNTTDVALARDALSARLIALSKAHDLLLSGEGEDTDMHAVITGALQHHDDEQPSRIRMSGPPVRTDSRAALSLALMMHELATNALKYGALSTPHGQVTVEWTVTGGTGQQIVRLAWRERGGPAVEAPTRKGFGSRLIEKGLAGTVGGEVVVEYARDGLSCTLTAPLSGFVGEH